MKFKRKIKKVQPVQRRRSRPFVRFKDRDGKIVRQSMDGDCFVFDEEK